MTKFVALRGETYSYLIDDGSEDKKAKDTKKCVIKTKLKFENYRNCLEETQLQNKINYLEKIKLAQIVLKSYKQFIRNNKQILKAQQRFKGEKHNVVTKEISKITLISSDDKRLQQIDSIEPYAYGTSKDLVSEKEKIKCTNIIK